MGKGKENSTRPGGKVRNNGRPRTVGLLLRGAQNPGGGQNPRGGQNPWDRSTFQPQEQTACTRPRLDLGDTTPTYHCRQAVTPRHLLLWEGQSTDSLLRRRRAHRKRRERRTGKETLQQHSPDAKQKVTPEKFEARGELKITRATTKPKPRSTPD